LATKKHKKSSCAKASSREEEVILHQIILLKFNYKEAQKAQRNATE
jgi:hypothetical protein